MLCIIVEAARSLTRNQRAPFYLRETSGGSFLTHPYLPNFSPNVYRGDIEVLAGDTLLSITYGQSDRISFDVLPRGFKYYEFLRKRSSEPVQQIQDIIREYVASNHFEQTYPGVYQKWNAAERNLWSSDSQQQLTIVGHLCREAMQEFAHALVERFQPPNVDLNKAHDIARIRAVLNLASSQTGNKITEFVNALLSYWATLSDLVQRQEHGAQKEGRPLIWDDARRIVFHTTIIFYEVDHLLSHANRTA